ncbi:MAG: hypothetical protein B7Y00_05390 [Sphingomonadales bacterium 17-56-6]|nr:MAG: hypothetical protein B7Y44_01400 [Sphingomonadales bacterium 28-55-16]OYZ87460.1 MAG: hypothetical protein B7Y00_05390 [Sphingomonadales bacterium 17-56-6]
MLTALDDTLWHQLPTTFDHVWTSDPRFFDRYWFAIYSGDGRVAIQITMGAYRNMNVLDAGAVMIVDGKQHNLRVSRSLNGSVETVCGPLRITPIEALKSFEIMVEPNDGALHGHIQWECVEPAHEEDPHYTRLHGRTVEDYRRFDQIGTASGFLEVDGKRIDIDNWWSCRDHSWGVRRGMGVPEPVTGPKVPLSEKGHVMAFLFFSTSTMSGSLLFSGRGDDLPYTTGVITERETHISHHVTDIALEVELHEGTRRFRRAGVVATLQNGQTLNLDVVALGPSIAMQGLGYSGGYNDGRGLGAWRGDNHLESDVWDVSHPAKVILPDGTEKVHWHRIQPVSITADVEGKGSSGSASMTLTIAGQLPEHLKVKSDLE